ncbi:MAG: MiaB/RimO family radical SAM methylthiotransferase [Candidatus Margulisiibacteriota bacterium]
MSMTYFILTFGCQMNQNDSEKLAGLLDSLGYEETTAMDSADLILLNTCSVRNKAETRFYGNLGRLKKLKEVRKEKGLSRLLIGVCGCIPQHAKEEIFKKARYVDFIFGVNSIEQLPLILERVLAGEKRVIEIAANAAGKREPDKTSKAPVIASEAKQSRLVLPSERLPRRPDAGLLAMTEGNPPIKRTSLNQAFVSIMYGCDNYCSYCIVPFTRGQEISRPKEEIFAEIKAIDLSRFNEIVLLGQNVNSYGKGLYTDYDFADLLKDVATMPGLPKIGFMTSHPKDMSDKLIRTIADNPKISRELHIPIQAGDDEVLKRMNRKYTVQDYSVLLDKIRRAIPEARISTDVIAGFPGETDEQFENTLRTLRKLNFCRIITTAYSPRPLTAAADFPDQVPVKVKAERLQRLMQVAG